MNSDTPWRERLHSRRAVLGLLGVGAAAGVTGAALSPEQPVVAAAGGHGRKHRAHAPTSFRGAVDIFGSAPSSPQLIVRAASSQSAKIVQIERASGAQLIVVDRHGHVGIGTTNPVNAALCIGSGTGTLAERPGSGIDVKLDVGANSIPVDGVRANVRVRRGTPGFGVRGLVAQLDIDGGVSSGTSDCIALWGETYVTSAVASPDYRNTWGLNTDVTIFPLPTGGINPYAGAAVGAEIGMHNGGGTLNDGGPLALVSQGYKVKGQGDNSVAFGAMISSGTGSLNPDPKAQNQIHCNILMPTNAGRGPANFAIYYGTTAAGNVPQYDRGNPPYFSVDAHGNTFARSLGVGNSIPASTPGKVIGAIPIYTDASSGPVAGYIPIYDHIS